jgi:lipoprotein-releasing system permease protein
LNIAGFIANRIAFNRQKSFSRFIIRLSVTATAISVAVMIVTLAFVNGFQQTVSNKIFSFWGHIRVQDKQPERSQIAEQSPIIKNDTVVTAIKKNPAVKSIHAFATKYAVLKTKDEMHGVLIKGLGDDYDSKQFTSFMKQGRWINYDDTAYSKEIIISVYAANLLKLKLNDTILTYFIQDDATSRVRKLQVVGIFKTGIEDYDKTFAISDIRLIQRLANGWTKKNIGGYEVFLNDYRQMDKVKNELYEMAVFPQKWDTKGINESYQNIFDWLNMQDTTRNVLLGLMTFVAVINLITCLIILVLERIRMIGVLKALGATDLTVQKIFLQHSSLITITGIVIGLFFGLGICWLQQATGFIKLDEDAYYMSTAAVQIIWWQVALVCIATLLVSFLVLTIPSLIVRKVQPVKAIQFR